MGKYKYSGTIAHDTVFEYFPFQVSNGKNKALDVALEVCKEAELWQIQRELSILEIKPEALDNIFENLSKGEQTKILLAALFLKENHFLLIDEPTNHLDIEGRWLVAKYLSKKEGFILVSHDRAFLDGCIDHVLSINRADITVRKGDFGTWLKNKEDIDNLEKRQNIKLKNEINRLNEAAKEKATWANNLEKTKYNTKISGLRPDRGYIGHKSAKMMKRAKNIENRQEKHIEEKSKLLKNIDEMENLKLFPLKYHSERLICFDDVDLYYDDRKVCHKVNFTLQRGDKAKYRCRFQLWLIQL